MGEQAQVGRSRRALLAGAAGAVAGMVAGALGRPAPAWAVSTQLMTEANNNAAAPTRLYSSQATDDTGVFAAYGTSTSGRVAGLRGQSASSYGFGVYGLSTTDGVGVSGRSVVSTGVMGVSGSADVGGRDGLGVYGVGPKAGIVGVGGAFSGTVAPNVGTGVYGAGSDSGVYGTGTNVGVTGNGMGAGVYGTGYHGVKGVGAIGVHGSSPNAGSTGVLGQCDAGTGVAALSSGGTALKVTGKARFNRSGRKSVAKNKAYVDVDLRAIGGISSTALCFANLAYPRSGVYVRAVRPNYPATGFMRIYLNKVASTTASTPLSWLVLESA